MPTIKQKKAFERIVENHGNVSKTMREVGYDETTAKNPKNLTESDGWNELIKKHLSDTKLAKVHSDGLEANIKGEPDYSVRHKYLDTAYKLKGSYAPEKKDITTQGDRIILEPDKIIKINEIALDESE